jgi:hypothetical protein
MPLVSDGKSKPLAHSNLRSIRFWMSVQGRGLVQPVRVVISTRPCRSSTRRTFGIYMAPWKISTGSDRKSRLRQAGMPAVRLTTGDLTQGSATPH